MCLPLRRATRMRRSTSRWSWLETACWLVPTASASSVTVSSPARSRAWMSRRRVSLASSSNRATTSAACRWVSRAPAVPYPGHEPAAWPESCRGSSTLFARGDPEARPEGAGGRMVIGWPPQSRFEMTLVVAFGASRELTWTGTAGTHLVLMDAPRIHHETTTRSLQALSRQNRRSVGVSVEPEGGFEPPTCRLRAPLRPSDQPEPAGPGLLGWDSASEWSASLGAVRSRPRCSSGPHSPTRGALRCIATIDRTGDAGGRHDAGTQTGRRAPRGAHLPAGRGGRAGAHGDAAVPVRDLQPQAARRRGPYPGAARGGRALAQGGRRYRRAGDAPSGAGQQPAGGGGDGADVRAAELPAGVAVLPAGGRVSPAAVRRGGPAALPVPGAAGGHGAVRRRRDRAVGDRGAAHRRGRDHPAARGLRHRGPPVPGHRRGLPPPDRQAR